MDYHSPQNLLSLRPCMNQSFQKLSGHIKKFSGNLFNFSFFVRAVSFFNIGPKIQSRKILIRNIEQIQVEISLAENIQDSEPLIGFCAI